MQVVCVRHGETNYNVQGLCNDDPDKDVHLTKKGKQQVHRIAQQLAGIVWSKIFVSDLPRTQESAQLLAPDQQEKVVIDPRIRDRKTGFDSQPVAAFHEAIADDILHATPPGGESFIDEKERVEDFLRDLSQDTGDYILIVSHNEILKIIYGHFHDLTAHQMWETAMPHGSLFQFEIRS